VLFIDTVKIALKERVTDQSAFHGSHIS
jgi:hypothetical protein